MNKVIGKVRPKNWSRGVNTNTPTEVVRDEDYNIVQIWVNSTLINGIREIIYLNWSNLEKYLHLQFVY